MISAVKGCCVDVAADHVLCSLNNLDQAKIKYFAEALACCYFIDVTVE